jgi:hypothetical protein
MVIAALVCFSILLVAWMLAPTDVPRARAAAPEVAPDLAAMPEAA